MASFQKRRGRNRLVGRLMDLAVGDIAPGGWGIGAFQGKRVYIRGAVPGDRVRARVVRQERGRIEARVEQVVSEGRSRIPTRCEHFSVCGGCLWQDLDYADQLALKKGIVATKTRVLATDVLAIAPTKDRVLAVIRKVAIQPDRPKLPKIAGRERGSLKNRYTPSVMVVKSAR